MKVKTIKNFFFKNSFKLNEFDSLDQLETSSTINPWQWKSFYGLSIFTFKNECLIAL